MTMTIAICAIVVESLATQNARTAGIRRGSGSSAIAAR
jgi:hypothetical protein